MKYKWDQEKVNEMEIEKCEIYEQKNNFINKISNKNEKSD